MRNVLLIVSVIVWEAHPVTWLGSYDSPGQAMAVDVAGNYAYLADGDSGLAVIDISTPGSPSLVKKVPVRDRAWDVVVGEEYAYVADGDSGLQVVDIVPPDSARTVYRLDTLGRVRELAAADGLLFAAGDTLGVFILTIASPIVPIWRSRFDTDRAVLDIAAGDGRLYATEYLTGVHVLDVSEPTLPAAAAFYGRTVRGLALSDSTLWTIGDHVQALDARASDTLSPLSDYCCTIGSRLSPAGTRLYVANSRWGLRILDVADRTQLSHLGSFDTPGRLRSIAARNDTLYLADSLSGLHILDARDPSSPPVLDHYGGWPAPTAYAAVGALGDYACVANWYHLDFLDASDPDNIWFGAYSPAQGNHFDVRVVGSLVYSASGGAGLQITDAANPAEPVLLGQWDSPGQAHGVAVQDTIACLVDRDSGLHVLSVSDPSNPGLLGSITTPGASSRVDLYGTHAYVAEGDHGIQIVDLSDPANPALRTPVETPGEACNVTVAGDWAFIADGWAGVHALDLSDPDAPVIVDTYDTPGRAVDVFVRDALAYVGDSFSRIPVLDVSQPADMNLHTTYQCLGGAVDLAASLASLYVAEGEMGLSMVDIQGTTSPRSGPTGWRSAKAGLKMRIRQGRNELHIVVTTVEGRGCPIRARLVTPGGRTVTRGKHDRRADRQATAGSLTIDLHGVATGVYQLTVETESGTVARAIAVGL